MKLKFQSGGRLAGQVAIITGGASGIRCSRAISRAQPSSQMEDGRCISRNIDEEFKIEHGGKKLMAMEIRGLKNSELDEHAELVYLSYSHERQLVSDAMLAHQDWWLQGIARDPYYEKEQTRVMVLDGKLVSSVTCYLRPSYIAGRIAKAVCIGSVCTHPEYRRRGLLRQTLAEAARWMISQGVLWSFLYGNEAVYGSSGWRNLTSWILSAVRRSRPLFFADLCVRSEFSTDIVARPADSEADVPVLAEIYDEFNSGLTGTTRRTVEYWRRRVLTRSEPWANLPVYYLLERHGRAVGYYAGENANVSEIGWRESPYDVLAFILRQWPDQMVLFPLYNTEILKYLRMILAIPRQQEYHEHQSAITLRENYQGLWRYLQDPEGLFPEFSDTEGLIRFLREHDYVMWNVDKS